jgi:formylglycine-generating enzyme required for sulfatase activity
VCALASTCDRAQPSGALADATAKTDAGAASESASAPAPPPNVERFTCLGAALYARPSPGEPPALVRACFDIERCDAAAGACVPACPDGEVYVPATGAAGFTMGKGLSAFGFGTMASHNRGAGRADAPHRVVLTKPFCVDATEVTGGAYYACVKEHRCKPPKLTDSWLTYRIRRDHPINCVDWTKAKNYCEVVGKSLPTEAQWEWAAIGGDGRIWPWGDDEPTCERADFTPGQLVSPGGDSGCHGGGTSPVGIHPAGDRIWPAGRIHDLAGNVWEWCLDSYLPYSGEDEVDPMHDSLVANRVIRGGGWNRSARGIVAAFRGAAIVSYEVPGLGFRCVRNAVEAADR